MVNEVYNEDCMVCMARYPDKYFDLAVVDPPYGININMNMGLKKGKAKKHDDKHWDACGHDQKYFNELFRVSVHQIIWGGNYFNLPPTQCFLIWDKGESIYGRSFAEVEQAWTSFKTSARIFKRGPNQTDRIHPTQKPIQLYDWIFAKYISGGGKVLDTHLGSGSSRIAAHKTGNIDFTAFEIDKDYYEAQEKRFKQFKAQQRLFI